MSEPVRLCPGCGFLAVGESFDRLGRRWHDSCFERVHPSARESLAYSNEPMFVAGIQQIPAKEGS